jgi:hypothetical protein
MNKKRRGREGVNSCIIVHEFTEIVGISVVWKQSFMKN